MGQFLLPIAFLLILLDAINGGYLLYSTIDWATEALPAEAVPGSGCWMAVGFALAFFFIGPLSDFLPGSIAAFALFVINTLLLVIGAFTYPSSLAGQFDPTSIWIESGLLAIPVTFVIAIKAPFALRLIQLKIQPDIYRDIFWFLILHFSGNGIGFMLRSHTAAAGKTSAPLLWIVPLVALLAAFAYFQSEQQESYEAADETSPLLRAIPRRLDTGDSPLIWIPLTGILAALQLMLVGVYFYLNATSPVETKLTVGRLAFISFLSAAGGVFVADLLRFNVAAAGRAVFGLVFIGYLGASLVFKHLIQNGQIFQAGLEAILGLAILPGFCSGMMIALIVRLVLMDVGKLNIAFFAVMACASLGACAGLVLLNSYLLENMGLSATLQIGLAVSTPLALLAILTMPGWLPFRLVGVAFFLALGAFSFIRTSPEKNVWARRHGVYPDQILGRRSASCLAVAVEWGGSNYILSVDGMQQGQIPYLDRTMQMGYAPTIWHENPAKVLILGFGTGALPFAASLDKRIQEITVIESCVPLFKLHVDFSDKDLPESNVLLKEERLQVLEQSKLNFLRGSKDDYDLVYIDPTSSRLEPIEEVLTEEGYAKIVDRLTPDGVLVQSQKALASMPLWESHFNYIYWFDTTGYALQPENFAPPGSSAFILASKRPLSLTSKQILDPATFAHPALQDSLRRLRNYLRDPKTRILKPAAAAPGAGKAGQTAPTAPTPAFQVILPK